MALTAGQTLTHYEILEPIGAGGMGEVWRARDTKLGREVAIKVLPEAFVSDEDRLRRFEREARSLAALSHANVAGIHGVDQVGDICFLALELVPGEDLSTRIERGALPLDEALDVCRQIAEGLEAAHEAGVVHRDLKPANVRITPQGVVKLLDFGLAKPAATETGSGVSTAASDSFLMTEDGVVLGTPTYMSPEQARGRVVDRRTDVWALGCVLYECLTGSRAFHGSSMPDVFAAIVDREPDWSLLPARTPPPVVDLAHRALEKDPRVRLRDAGEARVVLERARSDPTKTWGGRAVDTAAPTGSEGRRGASGLGLVVTALLALLGGVVAGRLVWPALAPEQASSQPPPLRRFVLMDERTIPDDLSFSQWQGMMEVSPDGRHLVTRSREGLLVLGMDGLEPEVVPVGDSGSQVDHASWTPDGRELLYAVDRALYRHAYPKGPHVALTELAESVGSFTVVGDVVVYTEGDEKELFQVPLGGGRPERFLAPLEDGSHWDDLRLLPGTDRVLAIRHSVSVDDEDPGLAERKWLSVASRDGWRELVELEADDRHPCYVAGHIVIQRDGEESSLWALPFSRDDLQVTGRAFYLWPGRSPSTSREGDLVYFAEGSESLNQLAWVDRQGRLELFDEPRSGLRTASLSRDGSRVVFGAGRRVFSHDVLRDQTTLLATLEGEVFFPHVLPGGRVLVMTRVGPMLLPPGPSEPTPWDLEVMVPWVAPDGSRALIVEWQRRSVSLLELRDGMPHGEPQLLREDSRGFASMHPDGSWYIFASDHSGEDQHYLSRHPDDGRLWPVGAGGSDWMCFGYDGDEILYTTDGGQRLLSMSFTPGDEPGFGEPVQLFDGEVLGVERFFTTNPAADGRFVVVKRLAPSEGRVVLVQGWRGGETGSP